MMGAAAVRARSPPAAVAEDPTVAQFGPTDVMLVTGGGKGIAAECALCLARETGVSLALIGRSRTETDAGLAANLERMSGLGVRFHYIAADVVDAGAVRPRCARPSRCSGRSRRSCTGRA